MSETLNDMMSGNVVIIHPGSLYLRIGKGSDASPVKIIHAIARRRKSEGVAHQDTLLIPQAKLGTVSWNTLDDARLQVFQALSKVIRRDGTKREPPSSARVLELNSTIQPEKIESDKNLDEAKDFDEVIVGDEVLTIPSALPYNVHFPFKRGDLNLHSGVGGSLSSILMDLQEIWSRSIETHLGIQSVDLRHYKAVLVIPTLYRRNTIKHYLSLLLLNMGFGGCFVVQDHVAATFGAGLAAACVVDIGDQKTSISCVEDGISQPSSRIQLGYGGSDISQLLFFLSKQTGFTYKSCNTANVNDGLILHQIKEEKCNLNLDEASLVRHIFNVEKFGKSPLRYSLYLGDEAIVAPLGYFQTDLLEVTGKKSVNVMGKDPGDSEDPHDHLYLRETSRKYTKTGDIQNDDPDFEDNDLETVGPDIGSDIVPIDQAIFRSIDMCINDDMKRKMFGSILIVGGGFRFPGAAQYLQARLAQLLGTNNPPAVEVMMDPKDGDSDLTVWRGAAVMAAMESAQELWIKPREWAKHGQKILRERAPFPWA
eukprot:GFUD01004349.1.p1 GENE.GFUD01004349.1~~GFUD01004349.1.p1  ORF type:complete len:538 (+),score=120.50 GFUD01004349.1:322-1935(+)